MRWTPATSMVGSLAGMLVLVPVLFCEQHEAYAQALSASEQALTKEKILNLCIRDFKP